MKGRISKGLADPWSWLVAVIGAGVAWALSMPAAAVVLVGLVMLVVAAVVGAVVKDNGAEQPESLRGGTPQFQQLARLQDYQQELQSLQRSALPPSVVGPAGDAVAAADQAKGTALEAAVAVDALDSALGRAGKVARTMSASDRVSGPVGRMLERRDGLLTSMTAAADGVGEVYAKLLELSTSSEAVTLGSAPDPVGEVNTSLDTVRTVLVELQQAARTSGTDLA